MVVEVAAETAVEEAEVMVAAKSEVIMVATKASFFISLPEFFHLFFILKQGHNTSQSYLILIIISDL